MNTIAVNSLQNMMKSAILILKTFECDISCIEEDQSWIGERQLRIVCALV